MRESTVEKYFVKKVREAGGEAEKFVSPGRRGVPDRVVSLPGGRVDWVELKAPNGRLKPEQERDHERRRAMGHPVWVLFTKEQVDRYIECRT